MIRALGSAAILAAAATVALAAPAAAETVPTGHNPKGFPTSGCFWTGPFTSTNPKTNDAYPGKYATYWGAKFRTPPGSTLTLRGRFPHARYISFNSYVEDGVSTGSVPDAQIVPDPGSTNPFVKGHRRDRRRRSYALRLESVARPANPVANTLYAAPAEGSYQDILYRVYLPDRGRGRDGGAGLPVPELKLGDGRVLTGQALCDALNANHDYRSTNLPIGIYRNLVNTPGKDSVTNPAVSPPFFEKFFNIAYLLSFFQTAAQHAAADATPKGAQYNNSDAAYLASYLSNTYGKVLMVRGRAPRTPRTFGGERVMGGGQLRYWDVCFNESLVTTDSFDCVADHQTPLDRHRNYTIAVSKKQDRPRNATARCGVAWLQWDPKGDGVDRLGSGALQVRQLLPSPGFGQSAAAVTRPGTAAQVMGSYFPKGTYMTKRKFEARGCRGERRR